MMTKLWHFISLFVLFNSDIVFSIDNSSDYFVNGSSEDAEEDDDDDDEDESDEGNSVREFLRFI